MQEDLNKIKETVEEVFVDLFQDLSEEERKKVLLGIEEDIPKAVKIVTQKQRKMN